MSNTCSNIGICHFRIGKTDGVSLEIEKRKELLVHMGHIVKTISGGRNNNADFIIPELEFDAPELVRIKENAFFELKDFTSGEELMTAIDKLAARIEHQFLEIQEQENFGTLFLHNIFSHALNLPAAKAFYEIARKNGITIAAVHHDFYWDGRNAQIYQPTCEVIQDFVDKYLPPQLPNVSHIVINSLNQEKLKQEHGINAKVAPDTFNFEQKPWVPDEFNSTLLQDLNIQKNDIFVLQATRVVERKAIELAVEFVAELTKRKNKLVGKTLYNGKTITEDSKVVLVLAGYTEDFALPYRKKLEDEIKRTGIEARFADHYIDTDRLKTRNLKIYSLWDSYVFADIITYPSLWEGWGNQFVEAIFAKKPIVVFEYPVFKSDIKPEGYNVISLGDALGDDLPNRLVQVPATHTTAAVTQAITTLTDPATPKILEQNFVIGKKHHGRHVLEKILEEFVC